MEIIKKWVLKNAVDHKGKASPGFIISKLIGEDKSFKDRVKEIMPLINEEVKRVNKLPIEKQTEELESIAPELLEQKEQQLLPELPNTKEVVMVFPPDPSKYPHLGHAKACVINHYYARKYGGKFYLRFEDSNPDKVESKYYESAVDSLKWLGLEWDDVHYVSDYFDLFITEVGRLVNEGKAYVCDCEPEVVRELKKNKKECGCRKKQPTEHINVYRDMVEGRYESGKVVVRLKIDMCHKNSAMRDPSIARVNLNKHPRTGNKFKVYPLYDFATAYMDGIEKITHRIRSKEFEMKRDLQEYIHNLFGVPSPYVFEMGRFNLKDKIASGRQIREMVERGEVNSWDDPRLTTLISYKRRGFQSKAVYNFVLSSGLSKAESLVSEDVLSSENRKILDPTTKRFYFVPNPTKLKLIDYPKDFCVDISLHPTNSLGTKHYELEDDEDVIVDKEDFEDGQRLRLKDLMNVQIKKDKAKFIGTQVDKGLKKVQWVLDKNKLPAKVVMLDASLVEGYVEDCINIVKEDEVVQLERFGFVRVDKIDDKEVVFYFAHK